MSQVKSPLSFQMCGQNVWHERAGLETFFPACESCFLSSTPELVNSPAMEMSRPKKAKIQEAKWTELDMKSMKVEFSLDMKSMKVEFSFPMSKPSQLDPILPI